MKRERPAGRLVPIAAAVSPKTCGTNVGACSLSPKLISKTSKWSSIDMGIIWTIIIGLLAGIVAKFIMPGPNEPSGFVMTAVLGIVGAFVASYLGQAMGWYGPNEGAGLIGAIVGSVIVLFVWGMISGRRA
jgi:uncharacterized membrane protein YeaQ/YmgE (transglycosylase-associated protein family)